RGERGARDQLCEHRGNPDFAVVARVEYRSQYYQPGVVWRDRGGGAGDESEDERTMKLDLTPGGYVVGLGSDIVDVDRIRRVWERQGERFSKRVFTEEELEYCLAMKYPHK